ncbi:hypothetical protein LCM20_18085 [Halobacillus litoralis]|uniref:hypothetical protein n=1 Tax=Halobacillus litoralis TaxID=45668 RepID=UPI001CD29308|nr:hypothetical protein [Halobacillus litoralis]MCA0972510.1 hypothetical protein [Halobacillus litoralis]
MNKSPILAFFLALIPGFGHMYIGKKVRGFFYMLAFGFPLFLAFVLLVTGGLPNELLLLAILGSSLVWIVNMLDMIMTLLLANQRKEEDSVKAKQNERFFTIFLSLIPGLGHFHLGLNQRGLTFLTAFIGMGVMILFVTVMTSAEGFLVFLLALPVIWIYGLFDVIQLQKQKDAGEELEDRTLMEDLDRHRSGDQKSKVLATILGIFPGAGHMYMGLQRRGLQLMAGFLLSIYILDVLRLSFFLFLIPVIWFYSFFDTLQQSNKMEHEELSDVPIVKQFVNHQRWFGIILILLGVFYLVDRIAVPLVDDQLRQVLDINLRYYYDRYFQLIVVSVLFIGGGIKLLTGSKKKGEQA